MPDLTNLTAYGVLLAVVVAFAWKGLPAAAAWVAGWLDNLLANHKEAVESILADSDKTRKVFEETIASERDDRVAERTTWAARMDESQKKIIEILQQQRGGQ